MDADAQDAFMVAAATGLFEFGKSFGRGVFSDVAAWVDGHGDYVRLELAFIGNAEKVSRIFKFGVGLGEDEDPGASGAWLSVQISRALKIKDEAFRHERFVVLAEFLQRLEGITIYDIAERDGIEMPFSEASVTFIAEPGYPWPMDFAAPGPFPYWSAKKRSWVEAERPGWLIKLQPTSGTEAGTEERVGVNPCVVFPPDDTRTREGGPCVGDLAGMPLFVTHSMTLLQRDKQVGFHKELQAAIEGIRGCGGLLFPSLAVGPLPASNFGPITLVGRLELALAGLKPYRKRGRRPSWVFATDAWTETTSQLMNAVAARLFREFHGHEDYIYGRHMWALGPPAEGLGSAHDEDVIALETTRQLSKALKERMKRFKPDLTFEGFEQLMAEVSGFHKYAYCEAKGREVVSLDEFPYLMAPESMREPVDTFVRGVGYNGRVVFIYDGLSFGRSGEHLDFDLYQWSWKVAQAIAGLETPVRVEL